MVASECDPSEHPKILPARRHLHLPFQPFHELGVLFVSNTSPRCEVETRFVSASLRLWRQGVAAANARECQHQQPIALVYPIPGYDVYQSLA